MLKQALHPTPWLLGFFWWVGDNLLGLENGFTHARYSASQAQQHSSLQPLSLRLQEELGGGTIWQGARARATGVGSLPYLQGPAAVHQPLTSPPQRSAGDGTIQPNA